SPFLLFLLLFFSHYTAPPDLYPLSLHDALPISLRPRNPLKLLARHTLQRLGDSHHGLLQASWNRRRAQFYVEQNGVRRDSSIRRSEEHTSELQSRENLVCRLLLEKKKTKQKKRE